MIFDLDYEENRARAYLHKVSNASPPTSPEEAMERTMTIGILNGIINALAAVQGKIPLDYTGLGELTDDD